MFGNPTQRRGSQLGGCHLLAHLHRRNIDDKTGSAWRCAGEEISLPCLAILCGIVITNREDLAVRARSIHDCGRMPGEWFYSHFTYGSNYRMTEWHSAILSQQLSRLDEQAACHMSQLTGAGLIQIVSQIESWEREAGKVAEQFKIVTPAQVHINIFT